MRLLGSVLTLAVLLGPLTPAQAARKPKKPKQHDLRGQVVDVQPKKKIIKVRVQRQPKSQQEKLVAALTGQKPTRVHTIHVNGGTRFRKLGTGKGPQGASFKDVHKGQRVHVRGVHGRQHLARGVDILHQGKGAGQKAAQNAINKARAGQKAIKGPLKNPDKEPDE